MFFSQFPKIAYDFNRTGTIQQMVNIFRSVRPETITEINRVTVYKKFEIPNGTRPDVLSGRLYGTPDYYWTFFLINDFLHDGLQVWPMSEEVLRGYLEKNYSGKTLSFKAEVVEDADGIPQGTKNSVAGLLTLGELIYGGTSGAVGRLVRKDADLNSIVLQDVAIGIPGTDPSTGGTNTSIVGGGFREGEFLSASQTTLDSSTLFSLQVDKVYDYSQAPAYYYVKGDPEQRPITTSSSVGPLQNIYSDVQWDSELQSEIGGFDINNFGSPISSIQSNAIYGTPLVYAGGYTVAYGESLRAGYTNSVILEDEEVFVTNEQHIRNLNEQRSQIKIIDPNYIIQFVEEFEKVLNV